MVQTPSWKSQPFAFKCGMFQGDPLTSTVFLMLFNPVLLKLKNMEEKFGYRIHSDSKTSSIITLPYGQESRGWISIFKLVTFCCCWKYTKTSIFLVKLTGQWIPNCDGRGIARDIKKNFIFKTWQKTVTNLGQFTKLGPFSTFQLFKLSKLCYHFWSCFINENIFFYIPSYPPPIAVRNSLTNQLYQKITFLYIFKTKREKLKFREGSRKLVTFSFSLKIYRKVFFFNKIDWSMNSGRRWTKNGKKNLDNLKSWNVEKGPNFVNCPNFVTIFVKFWK